MTKQEVASRSFRLVSQRFLLLVTPIAAVGVACRGFLACLPLIFHHKVPGLEFILMFFVFVPLGFLLYAVVAAMYLKVRSGEEVTLKDTLAVESYPGTGRVIARLTAMSFVWMLPAVFVGFVIVASLRPLERLMGVGVHRVTLAATGGHAAITVGLLLYAVVVYRYSFVLPMLAIRRDGRGDSFRTAVRHTKSFWGVLALIGLCEGMVAHLGKRLSDTVTGWHGGTWGVLVAGSVLAAVLYTYAIAFKTELLVQSTNSE